MVAQSGFECRAVGEVDFLGFFEVDFSRSTFSELLRSSKIKNRSKMDFERFFGFCVLKYAEALKIDFCPISVSANAIKIRYLICNSAIPIIKTWFRKGKPFVYKKEYKK